MIFELTRLAILLLTDCDDELVYVSAYIITHVHTQNTSKQNT